MPIYLTDEEMKKVAMKAAGEYIRARKERPIDLDSCLMAESKAIDMAYKAKNGYWSKPLTAEECRKIDERFSRLAPQLEEMTRKKEITIKRSLKTQAIYASTAQARLEGLLAGSGLSYSITCQKYRAKLLVDLPSDSSLKLHFNYRDVIDKDLDDLLPSLKKLFALVSRNTKKKKKAYEK